MPGVGRGQCRLKPSLLCLRRPKARGRPKQGEPLFTAPDHNLEAERWPSQLMPPDSWQAFCCLHDTACLIRLLPIMLAFKSPPGAHLRPCTAGTNCSHLWGDWTEGSEATGAEEPNASAWLCPVVDGTVSQGPTYSPRTWL